MGRLLALMATVAGLMAGPFPNPASAGQHLENAWRICDTQTARQERRMGIPRNLLKAISLAETGRWDDAERATFAWPWTVTALGQGRFFPNRQAALDYIAELRRRGIGNIDVGCMQINLFYHGGAFASDRQALDPEANTAYAASYLKELYQSTKSWTQAAAFYHSTRPERARAYKLKVLKHWNAARRAAASKAAPAGISAASTRVDYVRMAELNRRRKAGLESSAAADPGQLRRSQLAAWKNNGRKTLGLGQLAALRRAKLESRRRKQFLGADRDESGREFTAKRARQLDNWRLTGLIAGPG